MNTIKRLLISVGLIAGGFGLLMVSLMVWDELTTLQLYVRTCSQYWDAKCFPGYPFPIGPVLYGYVPEEVTWGMLIGAVILMNVGCFLLGTVVQELRKK